MPELPPKCSQSDCTTRASYTYTPFDPRGDEKTYRCRYHMAWQIAGEQLQNLELSTLQMIGTT